MNEKLQFFARASLAEGLAKLPTSQQRIFKLMYGRRDNGRTHNPDLRTVEETEALTFEEVVAEMPEERLDWAMSQVESSLKKLGILK